MVGMPGFWPGFLALEKTAGRGAGPGWLGEGRRGGSGNTVLQVYWDGEIQFDRSTWTEKYSFTGQKKSCIENPMY